MFTAIKTAFKTYAQAVVDDPEDEPANSSDTVPKESVNFEKDGDNIEHVSEFDDTKRGKETVLNLDPKLLVQENLTMATKPINIVTISDKDRIVVPENPPVEAEEEQADGKPQQLSSDNDKTFEEQFLLNTFAEEHKALKFSDSKDKVYLEGTVLVQEEATKDLIWKPVNPADPDEGDLHMALSEHGIIHVDRQMLDAAEPSHKEEESSESSETGTALASPPRTSKRKLSNKDLTEGNTKWMDTLAVEETKNMAQPPKKNKTSVFNLLILLGIIAMEYVLITRLWMSEPTVAKPKPRAAETASPAAVLIKNDVPTVAINTTLAESKKEKPAAAKKEKPSVVAVTSSKDDIPVESLVEPRVGSPVQPTNKTSDSIPEDTIKSKKAPKLISALEGLLFEALPVNQGFAN